MTFDLLMAEANVRSQQFVVNSKGIAPGIAYISKLCVMNMPFHCRNFDFIFCWHMNKYVPVHKPN